MSKTNYQPVMQPFLTSGIIVAMTFMAVGAAFAISRFILGLDGVTNLSNEYPWGIWIAIDVASGVALAAGGFTTAALVYIFNRDQFHDIIRPALLTAWLGYLFVSIGLFVDLGRYYNIWHPMIYWQGNSVLFEVGLCVMAYLAVLTIEFLPIMIEGLLYHTHQDSSLRNKLKSFLPYAEWMQSKLRVLMPLFILAGVVLSFMHQSSLGTLLLIAPTKVSPLWYTPILPLLFLSSAIAVGFPMVIIESSLVSKSLKRKPEHSLLTSLAGYIPYLLGIYAFLKIGDLVIRQPITIERLLSTEGISLLVELLIGILIPLFLFLRAKTYQSLPLVFTGALLIVFGVVLNRINVFLVGYNPPFTNSSYVPSIGELAITAGLIASIIFFYRVFITFFPVLPIAEQEEITQVSTAKEKSQMSNKAKTAVTWTFIMFFSLQSHALDTKELDSIPSLILINHPVINKQTDHYGTVRFMHKKHAALEQGNCTSCHHRVPQFEGDKIGEKIKFDHLEEKDPVSCRECHSQPLQADSILRPGIKGAFHQRCLDCHMEEQAGPTNCHSCHGRHVPDHTPHISNTQNPTPQEITTQCLECHPTKEKEILQSAHWQWEGISPDTVDHEKKDHLGKTNLLNNYCIHVASNWERCSMCHIGYGWKDETFNFNDASNIDCLVCHDTTGTYKKDKKSAGYPSEEVDLVHVAQNVGHPSRQTCGACHFFGGGGDGVKHGDLDSSLTDPPAELDVHMGKHNFQCQDCHITKNHQIAGACFAIPAREGRIACEDCHTSEPHQGSNLMNHHLNEHTKTIACQTCHIPEFARGKPTKMQWDWSQAGLDQEETFDQYGKPTFNKMKGSFEWATNVQPAYAWYDGTHERYVLGDKLSKEQVTLINQPLGQKNEASAKIAPFKIHEATQIADAVYDYLLVPNLWKGYWKHYDWDQAAQEGMESVGLEYSGEYKFVNTRMYWKLNHQIAPKENALHCYDCHDQSTRCKDCHQGATPSINVRMNELDQSLHANTKSHHFPFNNLGYVGDPIKHKARFQQMKFHAVRK